MSQDLAHRPHSPVLDVLARESRIHTRLARRLVVVATAVPLLAATASAWSPRLVQVMALDAEATSVTLLAVGKLGLLLTAWVACVIAGSFLARVVLVPGVVDDAGSARATRVGTQVGALLAVSNFVALTAYTDALVEAWVFPLLVFSAGLLVGVMIDRLRCMNG